jgi:hypothetical protein
MRASLLLIAVCVNGQSMTSGLDNHPGTSDGAGLVGLGAGFAVRGARVSTTTVTRRGVLTGGGGMATGNTIVSGVSMMQRNQLFGILSSTTLTSAQIQAQLIQRFSFSAVQVRRIISWWSLRSAGMPVFHGIPSSKVLVFLSSTTLSGAALNTEIVRQFGITTAQAATVTSWWGSGGGADVTGGTVVVAAGDDDYGGAEDYGDDDGGASGVAVVSGGAAAVAVSTTKTVVAGGATVVSEVIPPTFIAGTSSMFTKQSQMFTVLSTTTETNWAVTLQRQFGFSAVQAGQVTTWWAGRSAGMPRFVSSLAAAQRSQLVLRSDGHSRPKHDEDGPQERAYDNFRVYNETVDRDC